MKTHIRQHIITTYGGIKPAIAAGSIIATILHARDTRPRSNRRARCQLPGGPTPLAARQHRRHHYRQLAAFVPTLPLL